jgi:hypothetical protein
MEFSFAFFLGINRDTTFQNDVEAEKLIFFYNENMLKMGFIYIVMELENTEFSFRIM